VRRILEIAAGLGLAWLATLAAARASSPPVAEPAPPVDDAALPAHADAVASYTLRASLDPATHVVTGQGTIRFRNASRAPQGEVWLHLYLNAFKNDRTVFSRFVAGDFRGTDRSGSYGYITVKRLALGGDDLWPRADKTSPGDPEDETDIRVPLPRPLPPGESLELEVEFESHLPALSFRTGHFGGFHLVGQWFPKLARLEPEGRWAHFTFHRLSEFYADFGAYDVTIDTPESMLVGATGSPRAEVKKAGRVERRFVQEDVHDFAFTAWDQFHELSARTDEGVAVRVLYPPGHDRAAALELDAVRFGLRHFGRAYGRYPYGTVTVVHPPAGAEEAGGMEYPTLITTGGMWYGPWTDVPFLEAVTLHELGHQWFYGLVATDEHTFPFLDEGLNSYAESDVLEALFPKASAFGAAGLAVGMPAAHRFAAIGAQHNAPVAQPAPAFADGSDYGALVYSRTATILATLGGVYGEEAVRRAVGHYTRRFRFQHPGPDDLLQCVREDLGDDAATQLRVALFEQGTVDYTVADVTSEPDDPPRGVGVEAAPAPATAGGYRGSVLVRRRGALRFPVDVDLISADGATQRVRWDAATPSARLPWAGKSKLVGAVIDPEHRILLDEDLSNNARGRRSRALSGAVIDRGAFGVAAALQGVLP
jgi:hypothetical protein